MTTQPDRIPLDDLTSDQLDQLYARIDTLEAVCLSNKRAYAGAVQAALTAEARVRELEAAAPEVDRRSLHARHVAALTDAYPDLRHTADHIANISLGVRDEHVRELEQRVAELTAGQCTDALAVCEQHHRVPVTGCPYPRCKAAAARTTA
ncbi:hypothetical protein ABTX84_19275 [Streptomyces sp. NPDC095614]|uniref:hypothetical protein n=1 Tax=Streptomyces sp. NPDC095614 TaxID=3156692 RepID=UPI003319CCF4